MIFNSNNISHKALIDTSSLNLLLRDPLLFDVFLKNLNLKNIILYIPIDALMEIFEGGLDDLISTKLNTFNKIIPHIEGNKIYFTRAFHDWLCKEMSNSGRLKNIPITNNSKKHKGLIHVLTNKVECLRFLDSLAKERGAAGERKENLLIIDKKFREGAKQFSQADLISSFDKEPAPSFSELNFYYAALSKLPKFSRTRARYILTTKGDRYFYVRNSMHLYFLRAAGNAIDNFGKYTHVQFLQKLRKGNWDDLSFILMASKMKYLIAEDIGMRGFNLHLKQRGIVNSETLNLSEFVEK